MQQAQDDPGMTAQAQRGVLESAISCHYNSKSRQSNEYRISAPPLFGIRPMRSLNQNILKEKSSEGGHYRQRNYTELKSGSRNQNQASSPVAPNMPWAHLLEDSPSLLIGWANRCYRNGQYQNQ